MYSEWYFDYNILDQIYDSLLTTNPYDPSEWLPYIAKEWAVGTYMEGGVEKMYIDFWLRDDVYWSDCYQFTTADVNFSLCEAEELLAAKGCPDPWFSQNTWLVKNVTIYNDFYCRVYLFTKSMWALHSVGGSIMIPKHIWEPIILDPDNDCTDLQGWGPDLDPDMVGTGPYLFVEYVEASFVLLVKNTKYFLFNDMEVDVPHNDAAMQSYVGLYNRGINSVSVSVTLEYESSPGTWTSLGAKSVTVPGRRRRGVSYEAALADAGLLGNPAVKFRCSTSAPIRGVAVQRIRTTQATRPGDINCDNYVGLRDAVLLSRAYGGTYHYPPAEDINLDCSVGLADAVLLSTHYGMTSP